MALVYRSHMSMMTALMSSSCSGVNVSNYAPRPAWLRALDRVSWAENKELRTGGDDTLVRTKYLWLRSAENTPAAATDHF
jgi:hypothetical protein